MDKNRVLAELLNKHEDNCYSDGAENRLVRSEQTDKSRAAIETVVAEVYACVERLEAENEMLKRGIVPRGDDMIVPAALLDEINRSGGEWKERANRTEGDLAALRARVEVLEAVSAEYDDLIRHMDAGGDFYEFQASRLPKEPD